MLTLFVLVYYVMTNLSLAGIECLQFESRFFVKALESSSL